MVDKKNNKETVVETPEIADAVADVQESKEVKEKSKTVAEYTVHSSRNKDDEIKNVCFTNLSRKEAKILSGILKRHEWEVKVTEERIKVIEF